MRATATVGGASPYIRPVTLTSLRIGLEPGYDGGQFGAWLLDLPGAFMSASSRDLALSQAPGAAGWYRQWLARHGESVAMTFGPPEVVEEVGAWADDGYERNATFADDARPVETDEIESAIRRLDFGRVDLLDVLDRIERRKGLGRTLAGDAGERPVAEVLRHLAGAEAWFGSRLDPTARFDGASRDGDPETYLAVTRAWAIENLRRLHATDPAASRTDGKGETWTLRKVVRRYVYHSLDHLRELDRRLARAEDRGSRLRFSDDRLTDPEPLVRLLHSVGWDRRAEDPERLALVLAGTRATTCAWDGAELVGFAREHGDGVFWAIISTVCVDPRWQGLGIGERLVSSLVEGRDEVGFSLHAAGGMQPYYARLGFEPDSSAMIRRRRR